MASPTTFSQETCDEMYANQDIPDSLLERIRYQRGNDKLDLSLCNISRVPLKCIKDNYGEVYFVDLSFNSIRYLSHQFPLEFPTLTRLDLSKNNLRRLPDNIGCLSELVYLDLHQNELKSLPLSMGRMRRLQYLSIFNNPLRPPLAKFVGEIEEIPGVTLAELVTSFLRELQVEMASSQDTLVSRARSSRLRYNAEKIAYRNSLEAIDLARDENNNLIYGSGERIEDGFKKIAGSSSSKWTTAFRFGGIILGFWVLIPLIMGILCHTSRLKYMNSTMESSSVGTLWSFYYPIMIWISNITDACLCGMKTSLRLYSPEVELTIFQKFLSMFSFIGDFFSWMFG